MALMDFKTLMIDVSSDPKTGIQRHVEISTVDSTIDLGYLSAEQANSLAEYLISVASELGPDVTAKNRQWLAERAKQAEIQIGGR